MFFCPLHNLYIPISFTTGHIIFVLYDFSHIFYYAYTTIHLTLKILPIPYQFTFFLILRLTKKIPLEHVAHPFTIFPYHTTLNSILLAFKRPIRAEKIWEVKLLYGLDILCTKKRYKRLLFYYTSFFFILTVCHPNISIFEEEEKRWTEGISMWEIWAFFFSIHFFFVINLVSKKENFFIVTEAFYRKERFFLHLHEWIQWK